MRRDRAVNDFRGNDRAVGNLVLRDRIIRDFRGDDRAVGNLDSDNRAVGDILRLDIRENVLVRALLLRVGLSVTKEFKEALERYN